MFNLLIIIPTIDINECDEGSHNCEHNCTNTAGSFECSCDGGYKLDGNGKNCSGRYRGLCDVM